MDVYRSHSGKAGKLRVYLEEGLRDPARASQAVSYLVLLDEMERDAADLNKEATTDTLTSVGRRGSLERAHARFVSYVKAGTQPNGRILRPVYSILFFDVDDFGAYNKLFGDPQGDNALRALGDYLRGRFRRGDAIERFHGETATDDEVERYGGEEFAILGGSMDMDGARRVASEVRDGIASIDVPIIETNFQSRAGYTYPLPRNRITASVGAATSQDIYEPLQDVINRAIEAKNWAKNKGKNQSTTLFTLTQTLPQVA